MSMYSLPTLRRISRERLSSLLLTSDTAPSLAIIDVRDADHVGGHIAGSTHVPSSSLDYRIPELVRKLAEKDIVVFHCALSQQRGPSAALRYLREKESRGCRGKESEVDGGIGDTKEEDGKGDLVEEVGVEGQPQYERDAALLKGGASDSKPKKKDGEQEVFVLDGGFVKWQEL